MIAFKKYIRAGQDAQTRICTQVKEKDCVGFYDLMVVLFSGCCQESVKGICAGNVSLSSIDIAA